MVAPSAVCALSAEIVGRRASSTGTLLLVTADYEYAGLLDLRVTYTGTPDRKRS